MFPRLMNMNGKSIFVIFSFACFTFFFYGVFLTINSISSGKNDCRMTFMFEHPNYIVSIDRVVGSCSRRTLNVVTLHAPAITGSVGISTIVLMNNLKCHRLTQIHLYFRKSTSRRMRSIRTTICGLTRRAT